MISDFSAILEEFEERLDVIAQMADEESRRLGSPLARVSIIHAATLLLAATFEEFIRQMARQSAIRVVTEADTIADIPDELLSAAWKRTLNAVLRERGSGVSVYEKLRQSVKKGKPKIEAICAFIEGDANQDIFEHLIQNENHMRINEINGLFKISGHTNICAHVCNQIKIKKLFDLKKSKDVELQLSQKIEAFFKRRNRIAHSLSLASSGHPHLPVRRGARPR